MSEGFTVKYDARMHSYVYSYKLDSNPKKLLKIKIWDEYYDAYYKPGYLTDAILEQVVVYRKTMTFTATKPGTSININVSLKVIPYTTKSGYNMEILEFTVDETNDLLVINSNAEKIVSLYYENSKFNYNKPLKYVQSLVLSENWRTFAQNTRITDNLYCFFINVYVPSNKEKNTITFYGRVKDDKCEMISEETYKSLLADKDKLEKENQLKLDELYEVRKNTLKWLQSITHTIWPGGSTKIEDIINNAEPLVMNISVPDMESRIAGLLNINNCYGTILNMYINRTKDQINHEITINNYTDQNVINNIKNKLLQNIKAFIEYSKILIFRNNLLKEYKSSGLEAMTNEINIDNALSLGYFNQVQNVLVYKGSAPEYIIKKMYLDIIDINILKTNILNLLKVYYAFYDMPEKERTSIAKYIAKHKLSDYYDKIREFPDVYDVLIDNSSDKTLIRPIIESYIGTSKTDTLKNKTFYFEKRGKLVTRQKHAEIVLYQPVALLEELRNCIKQFNNSSDVAILVNIVLDEDESFIFQFYTFAESSGDEQGFDGRRMLNLTRIYNKGKPKEKKIGFNFSGFDETDSDAEEDT